jgi:hypothetical protein
MTEIIPNGFFVEYWEEMGSGFELKVELLLEEVS